MIKKADHILDNIIYATNDINASRLKLYEFFVLLNRYMNKDSQLKHAIPDYLFDDLKNIESRGEAKNYIHRYLLGIFKEIEEQNANKTTALLDKAVEYINTHYDEGITLDDVAYEAGFSTYYFGKIFKKTYKASFAEYLANVRVEKAKQLLEDPQLSIKDITYRIGYMDPNYFARIFKKSEGITPSEYRSNLQ
jgi:two-component system response regulator YesN